MKKRWVRSFVLCLTVILMLCCAGCGNIRNEDASSAAAETGQKSAEAQYTPIAQEDGGKLRIGLLDINEYEPASTYLYYVLEGLKEDGWIDYETLPFTTTNMDVVSMMQALSEMDLGPYIEFVGEAAYYMEYESEEEIVQRMQAEIDSEEGLDIILAMGTEPGLFMKEHDLNVNTLVCMATDPVAAGIIPSADDSGDPQLWAQVETLPYVRQLRYYHSIIPFENIGMVYTDPLIVDLNGYEIGAEELGITITKRQITEETAADVSQLQAIYQELIEEEKIDAYMLNANLIGSDVDVAALLEPFMEAGIPVFVQDGENYVESGGLLLVASTDNVGVGRFVAETIEQVAQGALPGDIPGEYVSSPYISLNLDTARRIGFQPDFDLLLACETIYSSDRDT